MPPNLRPKLTKWMHAWNFRNEPRANIVAAAPPEVSTLSSPERMIVSERDRLAQFVEKREFDRVPR